MQNRRTELQNIYPELYDLGINWFGYYSNKTTTGKLSKHHHGSSFEICYLDNGIQPYYIYPSGSTREDQAQLYRLHGGEVFITRPYEYHSSGAFQQLRGRLYWIQFDSEFPALLGHNREKSDILRAALESLDHSILRVPKTITSRFSEAFRLILTMDKEHLFRACELLTLFILELADFNRKISDESQSGKILSRKMLEAVTYIHNNLMDPGLNLDAVAEHLHYSRSYAMSAFRNEMGLTIHEFILQSKIEYACELLRNHTITETAFLLNFSSSQHFSRVFKEHTSLTPRDFVKQFD